METTSAQRILELWPALSVEEQAKLVETAERMAAANADQPVTTEFTSGELQAIEAGREDFKHGRSLTADELEVRSASFIEGLRSKARA